MLVDRDHLDLNRETLQRGYRNCRQTVRRQLRGQLWMLSNLSGDRRRGMDALLAHLLTTVDLLDLESVSGLSLDVWHEIRDDVSDAFRGRCTSPELAALVDTCRRFEVPRQHVFDPLRGADLWIRHRGMDTWRDVEVFCSHVGGATVAGWVPVLGPIKPGFLLPAIAAGKAVMLTQLLARAVGDLRAHRIFLARQDLEDCEVDLSHVRLRRPTPAWRHLVRRYTARLEIWFQEAAELLDYLDFDGRRSMMSLLGLSWRMMVEMRRQPERIFAEEGVLTRKQLLGFRTRHLLGLEAEQPWISGKGSHGHHV